MTYLEMINNILRRLRENTVSSPTQNEYAQLIGILVNDAKREVENSWQWSGLRQNIAIPTVNGTTTYELSDSVNRISIFDIYNDTDNHYLKYVQSSWMREQLNGDSPDSGSPLYYTYSTGVGVDGDTKIDVYPTPDGTYDLIVNAALREGDLVNNADTTLMPSQPILLLAYAKAVEERGEDAGVNSSSAYFMAKGSLGDHIALDAQRHPEELIWNEV